MDEARAKHAVRKRIDNQFASSCKRMACDLNSFVCRKCIGHVGVIEETDLVTEVLSYILLCDYDRQQEKLKPKGFFSKRLKEIQRLKNSETRFMYVKQREGNKKLKQTKQRCARFSYLVGSLNCRKCKGFVVRDKKKCTIKCDYNHQEFAIDTKNFADSLAE